MKKSLALTLALGLAAALSIPAAAQEAEPTTIPEVVQIEDPLNDANGLNDQGNRGTVGFQGDHSTPADAGSVSDILKVWFSHDADNVRVHFLTQAPAPASTAILFQVYSNPGGDFPLGCLRWAGLIPGANYVGDPLIKLLDRCNDSGTSLYSNGVEGTHTIEPGPDGAGILTLTFPRAYSPLLADNLSITKEFAESRLATGEASAVGFVSAPVIDNTVEGTDYVLTVHKPAKPKTPVKKGCNKGSPKAKKKGCKK